MFKRKNQPPQPRLTADEYELRIWGAVVIIVLLVFAGITAAMLYSVIFVTQPIKTMAPIDQAFTKMLNDIVLLIVGGIGGIMTMRGTKRAANHLANQSPGGYPSAPTTAPHCGYQQPYAPAPQPAPSGMPDFNWMGFKNPELDESWTPGPPPATPPDFIDPEAEQLAYERLAARSEA